MATVSSDQVSDCVYVEENVCQHMFLYNKVVVMVMHRDMEVAAPSEV